MKKKLYSLALALTCMVSLSAKVEARTESATLPKFDVTLNEQKVDNTYSQYPLLVYKDITYFPMTYNTARYLGLETNWSQATGLKINKTGVAGKFDFYNTNTKNNNSYQVSVPEFAITVNGKAVDNSKEQYPLLMFRDVTYFPMTWRFGVEEFGWDYDFTQARGLVINAKKVEAAKPINVDKIEPVKKEKVYEDYSKTEFYNGNYYVVKTNGENYRLFRESHVGGQSEQITDMEVKSFTRDGDKLYFVSGNIYYSYNMKTAKIEKEANVDRVDPNASRVVTIAGQVYYVNAHDLALYTDRNQKVNNGAEFENATKVGDYTILKFAAKSGSDRNQVYDSRGRMIFATDKEISSPKIENNQLAFYLENANRTSFERITIR